ncbi:MAG: hypothetical protein ACT4PJ_16230 [Gemmatimonadaceae bacterium]
MTVRHCVLIVSIAACGRMGDASAVDDSTFVSTMARLYAVERNGELTEAARDSARRQVLQEQGLTTAELAELARRYGSDATHAAAIWTAINRKLLSVTGDSVSVESGVAPLQEETR